MPRTADHGFSLILARPTDLSNHYADYLTKHGVFVAPNFSAVRIENGPDSWKWGTYSGVKVLYVRSRCRQLDSDNSCIIHGTDQFPKVCADYPTIYDDLTVVPECGYVIEEMEDADHARL